jgi:hypothetical protein
MTSSRRSTEPVPLSPVHRRTWRTLWRRCSCGLPAPCVDRLVPAPPLPFPPRDTTPAHRSHRPPTLRRSVPVNRTLPTPDRQAPPARPVEPSRPWPAGSVPSDTSTAGSGTNGVPDVTRSQRASVDSSLASAARPGPFGQPTHSAVGIPSSPGITECERPAPEQARGHIADHMPAQQSREPVARSAYHLDRPGVARRTGVARPAPMRSAAVGWAWIGPDFTDRTFGADAGRPGNLTPAQRHRASGGRL